MPRAEARYRITADDRTRAGVRSAESRLERFGGRLTSIAKRVGAAFVGFLGGREAVRLFDGVRRSLSRLNAEARESGTSAEELREVASAFSLLGAEGGRATDLIDALNDSLGDAIQDATSEKGRLFREQLQLDPSDLAGVENASDRIAAFAQRLEELEERGGRALREFVEQSLVGDDFSRVLDPDKFLAAIAKIREKGIPQGTNEAAAAAEEAGNAWRLAGEAWAKVLESSGIYRFLTGFGNVAANAAGIVNDFVRGEPKERAPQQQGIFLPRLDIESQNRATRAQEKAASSIRASAELLERSLNRYQP